MFFVFAYAVFLENVNFKSLVKWKTQIKGICSIENRKY